MNYSVDSLRKVREGATEPPPLVAAPANAPHDTDDALGVWNGERFVSWSEWSIGEIFGFRRTASSARRKTAQQG
jgi:hypothetical protein